MAAGWQAVVAARRFDACGSLAVAVRAEGGVGRRGGGEGGARS